MELPVCCVVKMIFNEDQTEKKNIKQRVSFSTSISFLCNLIALSKIYPNHQKSVLHVPIHTLYSCGRCQSAVMSHTHSEFEAHMNKTGLMLNDAEETSKDRRPLAGVCSSCMLHTELNMKGSIFSCRDQAGFPPKLSSKDKLQKVNKKFETAWKRL